MANMETNTSSAQINGVGIGTSTPITSFQLTNAPDTATSGITMLNNVNGTVAPTASSTRTTILWETKLTFNSNFPIASGGYLSPFQSTVSLLGTANVDKCVAGLCKSDFNNVGTVGFAIGYEPVIATVGASTIVTLYAGILGHNQAGVANIANVQQNFWALNQYVNALQMTQGPMIDTDYRTFIPSCGTDMGSSRLWTTPYTTINGGAIAAGTIYFEPIRISKKITVQKLGANVQTLAVGNMVLGLYKTGAGGPTTLVVQSGAFSTVTTGDKEQTVTPTTINPGYYFLAMLCDATPTMAIHNTGELHCDVWGFSSSTGAHPENGLYTFAYNATLPTMTGNTIAFGGSGFAPHMWIRT